MHQRLAIAALLIAPAAALAHHAGLYDESNIITLEGTIAEIEWINPHVRLTLETRAADGSTERLASRGHVDQRARALGRCNAIGSRSATR